jgi:hypothetical protein
MDFVKWCDTVLQKLVDLSQASPAREYGWVDDDMAAEALFGEEVTNRPEYWDSSYRKSIHQAIRELSDLGAITDLSSGNITRVKVTQRSRELAAAPGQMWEGIGRTFVTPEQQRILRAVNKLSVQEADDHAWLEEVSRDQMLAELGWGQKELEEALWPVSEQLAEIKFVRRDARPTWHVDLEATYKGLVWESWREDTGVE